MMMMEEQYSRPRISVAVDRISSLPKCILVDILSLLPTKQAVATSLLSKRWNFLWLDVHCLHFSFNYCSAEDISFVRFVHRALRLTHGRPLNKFSLVWKPSSISSHVSCWIDDAIMRNVRDIDLSLGSDDTLRLPISGFNCDSLRSLQINNIVFVYDITMVCLPRLESLKLDCVRFATEEAFEKLINGCPMLHSLKITVYSVVSNEHSDDDSDDVDDDDAVEIFTYTVSSLSLRHLDMYIQDRCILKLNAPSLEYLRLHGPISEIFVEKSLASLVEADFHIQLDEHHLRHNLIVEAVRALEHAKFLTLSACVIQAFCRATISLSTEFKRLVKLVAGRYCCSIQDFIHYSENLEDLIIRQIGSSNPPDHSRWAAPIVVPRCLSKGLKKVRIDGYKGLEDEREMIRYMLEHGTALEVLQIHCKSNKDGEKLELVQEICEFPRKSPGCKVQFDVLPMKRKFPLLY